MCAEFSPVRFFRGSRRAELSPESSKTSQISGTAVRPTVSLGRAPFSTTRSWASRIARFSYEDMKTHHSCVPLISFDRLFMLIAVTTFV